MSYASRSLHRPAAVVALVLVTLLSHGPVAAQSGWPPAIPGSGIGLELGHPFLKDRSDPAGALVLHGSLRLNPKLRAVVSMPLSMGTGTNWSPGDRAPHTERGAALGNLYVGVLSRFDTAEGEPPATAEIGVFLPTMSNDARFTDGLMLTHFVDRIGSLLPEVMTLRAAGNFRIPLVPGVGIGVRLGPDVLIRTDDPHGGDRSEIFATYGAFLGVSSGRATVEVGIDARTWLTVGDASDASFDDLTMQQFRMGFALIHGPWRPYADVKFPVGGDDDDFLNDGWILTVGVLVPVGP